MEVEDQNSSSEQFALNPDTGRVTGDLQSNVLSESSAVRRVEELRIRVEGQVQNTKSANEVWKTGKCGVKTYGGESSVTKSAAEAKQDGVKVDSRRSGANTRDSPPRKVSFRLRGSTNNGRLSSSHVSSAASRRSSNLNKALLTDARVPNLSSSKVAALTSKFNAIIHENKGERSGEVIQNDSKKKLPNSQLTTGLTTNTNKKQSSVEKLFFSRRNSSNSKREISLSNPGCNANIASLGFALRKHSFVKQPLVETDGSHKSFSNTSTKDCKRRNNMAYRQSAAGTKCGTVKAAIQIFEKNTTIFSSTKNSVVDSEEKRKVAVNTDETKLSLESAEAKKEPKYHRVKFKRDASLVRVTLDCEDVCNEDKNSEQCDDTVNIHCQQETPKLSPSNCDEAKEKICVKKNKDLKSYSFQHKSNQSVIVGTVKEGSAQKKTEQNQTKTKPTVPLRNVTKDKVHKNVPCSKNNSSDSNYVTVTCKPGSICGKASKASMTESTSVRRDKLLGPQMSSAVSGSAMKTPQTAQETEPQQDKETVAPNRSFLWGASVPGTNQSTSVPGTNQSASVPVIVTNDYESVKPDNSAHVTSDSTDDMYDDVYPPSAVCSTGTTSNHPYSVVQPQDDDVYDDVGPPTNEEQQCAMPPAAR